MTETNRYEHGKIYKIVSPHSNKIYVGSTCKKYLSQRMAKHKQCYKEWLKDKKKDNVSSFRLFELGDVEIILLESINCNTKDELLKKEREYIEKYKDIIVNKYIPTRTSKEWYKENNEKVKEKVKQYQKEHKEEKKEYHKEYREKHKEEINEKRNQIYDCVCGKQSIMNNKARHEKSKHHINFISKQ